MSGYRGRDAMRAAAAALTADAAAHGLALTVVDASIRPWASATFAGARHHLRVTTDGCAMRRDAWLADIGERDFDLAHHIVAEVTATPAGDVGANVELLTVEE